MDQQRSQITKVGCRRLCALHSERVVGCVAEQGYQRPRDFLPQLQHHPTALDADVAGSVRIRETDPRPGRSVAAKTLRSRRRRNSSADSNLSHIGCGTST